MYTRSSSLWRTPVREVHLEEAPPELPPDRPQCTRSACVPQLMNTVAEHAPDAIALTHGSEALTFSVLNTQANQLAGFLLSLGVGPEITVALSLEQPVDSIIAALAVWKAGGAYVPLDPAWPLDRRESIIDDSHASVLITRGGVTRIARFMVDLDLHMHGIAREASFLNTARTAREQLACVVYSEADHPLGVEITHGNLLNAIFWHRRDLQVTAEDRASHFPGAASAMATWAYLTAGARIAIPEENACTSPEVAQSWLCEQRISVAFAPARQADALLGCSWPAETALRALVSEGAPRQGYPSQTVPFRVLNYYGSAETTMVSMAAEMGPNDGATLPSIGKPIANTTVYLLDANGRTPAPGATGEIYIAGTGLARGYRNRPQLTAERFREDPLKPGVRMFRTGDLGCMRPDGQIAYCGRAVHRQVPVVKRPWVAPEKETEIPVKKTGLSNIFAPLRILRERWRLNGGRVAGK